MPTATIIEEMRAAETLLSELGELGEVVQEAEKLKGKVVDSKSSAEVTDNIIQYCGKAIEDIKRIVRQIEQTLEEFYSNSGPDGHVDYAIGSKADSKMRSLQAELASLIFRHKSQVQELKSKRQIIDGFRETKERKADLHLVLNSSITRWETILRHEDAFLAGLKFL